MPVALVGLHSYQHHDRCVVIVRDVNKVDRDTIQYSIARGYIN